MDCYSILHVGEQLKKTRQWLSGKSEMERERKTSERRCKKGKISESLLSQLFVLICDVYLYNMWIAETRPNAVFPYKV